MNLGKEKENFKNHITKFTDHGNIKILDFKEPDSSHYRIRFLFEEDYCRLHISGDLGELIATNYNNMTFEKFSGFVNNVGYFKEKINCASRKIEFFDEEKAREELQTLFTEDEESLKTLISERFEFETIDDVIDYILEDFDNEHGIGSRGYEQLEKVYDDVWEITSDMGRKDTGILDLYMLAFKLAMEQLNDSRLN